MSEASYEATEQAFQNGRPNARYSGDARLFVNFYMAPLRNEDKSLEAGRPIFIDTEFVEIRIPGDKDNVVVRPVRDLDRQRFRDRYRQFKDGTIQVTEGTPLEFWPQVSRAQVEELRYFSIRTVEQLAEVPDNLAQRFLGVQQLKQSAKAFVLASKDTAHVEKMRLELDARDVEIATLKDALQDLAARMTAQEKAKK